LFNSKVKYHLKEPLNNFQFEELNPESIQEGLDSDTESTIYVATPNNDNKEAHQEKRDESAKANIPVDSSTESAVYPTPDPSRDSSSQDDTDSSFPSASPTES
jgi:hypothetical protein